MKIIKHMAMCCIIQQKETLVTRDEAWGRKLELLLNLEKNKRKEKESVYKSLFL